MKWTTQNIPSQRGRRVVITGSNSGIGFETAVALARKGAELILTARTKAKGEQAASRILELAPDALVHTEILDLAVLASVHAFADRVKERFPGQSLDLLINNAGVMALPEREVTVDGLERQIATNYFGPFALTGLLHPAMKPVHGSRIVTVSSTAANQGRIDFDNLQSERVYKPMFQAYAQSKLAGLIFSQELQRRLSASGSPIISTAAHPGYAVTNLQADHLRLGMKLLIAAMKPLFAHDAAHGALPTLYAAIDEKAVPGGYYGPNGIGELKGYPAKAAFPERACDRAVAKRLWAESERLTGVKFGPLSGDETAMPQHSIERQIA